MASNTDDTALERRLSAVERAVDGRAQEAPDATATDETPQEERLTELERRIDELDAALQAVRGFLGGVDAVNESVESRADAAIAAVDRLERRLDESSKSGSEGISNPEADESVPGDDREGFVERTDEAAAEAANNQAPEAGRDDDRPLRDRLRDPW